MPEVDTPEDKSPSSDNTQPAPKVQKNFDSFSSQEYVEDDHVFILLDSTLLCTFLGPIVRCYISCNFLKTRICFEDGIRFCFDILSHCQT